MDADDQAILARLDRLGALLFARDPAIVDELWSGLGGPPALSPGLHLPEGRRRVALAPLQRVGAGVAPELRAQRRRGDTGARQSLARRSLAAITAVVADEAWKQEILDEPR
jgi:hypothetical protein